MKPKRYIIKKGKALISFSDIRKVAHINDFNLKSFRGMLMGYYPMYNGWSLEYVK